MAEERPEDLLGRRLLALERELRGLARRLERVEWMLEHRPLPYEVEEDSQETEAPPYPPLLSPQTPDKTSSESLHPTLSDLDEQILPAPAPLAVPVRYQHLHPPTAEPEERVPAESIPRSSPTATGAPPSASARPPAAGSVLSPPPWPSSKPPGPDWREALANVGMLPPTGKGNFELQLGTWWLTRIGALLFVICAVFFGVYVSRQASPWMRLIELTGVAAGMTAAGLWLERRYEQYGRVLFGAGLALIFFTAFAAYAIPPVKVVENPLLAALLQYAATVAIVICALRRDSRALALMAIFFGYVACVFSFVQGLPDYALAAGLLLGGAASFMYLARRWTGPIMLAVPATYFIYACIAYYGWHGTPPRLDVPPLSYALGWLLAYMLMFGAVDYVALRQGKLMEHATRRLVQLCNTTAALALGFCVTLAYFRDELVTFYFIFGAVLIVAAVVYYSHAPADRLLQAYLVKGTALITMGLISWFDARSDWIAVAIQSFVLLAAAWRSRLRITHWVAVLTWYVSLGLFLFYHAQIARVEDTVFTLSSVYGMLAVVYALSAAIFFSFSVRLSSVGALASILNFSTQTPSTQTELDRATFQYIHGVIAGLVALSVTKFYVTTAMQALVTAGFCVSMALLGLWLRNVIPYIAATLLFLFSHWTIWTWGHHPRPEIGIFWLSAVTVGILSLAFAVLAEGRWRRAAKLIPPDSPTTQEEQDSKLALVAILNLALLFLLCIAYYKTLPLGWAAIASVGTALLVVLINRLRPLETLADAVALPILFSFLAIVAGERTQSRFMISDVAARELPSTWSLWLATAGAFAYAILLGARQDFRRLQRWLSQGDLDQFWHLLIAMLIGYQALRAEYVGVSRALPLVIAAHAVAGLRRWPGLRPAIWLALLYIALGCVSLQDRLLDTGPIASELTWIVIASAALLLAFPFTARWIQPGLDRPRRALLQWLAGGSALTLLFIMIYRQGPPVQPYITVCWGISASFVFMLGLIGRMRPLRLLGVAGLLLCIPRVFLVDITSDFYRIIAFGVLGVVLLAIGFLYNKYKLTIAPPDEELAAENIDKTPA